MRPFFGWGSKGGRMDWKDGIAYGLIVTVMGTAAFFQLMPYSFLRGHGVSMEPRISDGDAIVIHPVARNEIENGDIISFGTEPGYLITHKVVGFENGRIITHGINLPEGDVERVEYSQVVGEHVLTIPKAGIVLQHIDSFAGFVLLVLVPAALIIYNEGRKIRREMRKGEE
ncbi:hypothetical protein AKJ57_05470 [candidate division MSBL1 archaeon SCGC-AAA259A05]|uniref:Peptidase S24/S26A/S26B/S26C domain-containing protein n=1 Tax=candidate division MSBL1 archaeon SCGC-AAA259A05 TaxID=1698259 RepID=A0A133U559_9EURY|nr:hypothetical protein AKJ57_05470 [candidate division MSBL1 archaeon SCGC-AAA259A05]